MNSKIKNLAVFALLTALMIIFSFTPLGYIRISTIEITLMSIPVIIGIFFGGIKGGLFLGAVFGITSFIQCFGMSHFGTALFSEKHFLTFIVCIVPRVFMGLFAALVFKAMEKLKVPKVASYTVLSIITPVLNTVFFITLLLLCFKDTNYIVTLREALGTETLTAFVLTCFGLNAVAEAAVCTVVGTAILKALEKVKTKLD